MARNKYTNPKIRRFEAKKRTPVMDAVAFVAACAMAAIVTVGSPGGIGLAADGPGSSAGITTAKKMPATAVGFGVNVDDVPLEPAGPTTAVLSAVRTIYVAGSGGQSLVDRCIGPIHFTPTDAYSVFIVEHDTCGGWARFSGIGVGETVIISGFGTYAATGRGQVVMLLIALN